MLSHPRRPDTQQVEDVFFCSSGGGEKKKKKATNDDVLVSILEPCRESGTSGQVLQQLPREERAARR